MGNRGFGSRLSNSYPEGYPFPADRVEARRAIRQVLALIESIALLHQFQRQRDQQERIVANQSDYALARRLVLKPLESSIGLAQRDRDAYEKLRENLAGQFDSTQADKALGVSLATRKRVLNALVGLKVLEIVRPGKGRTPALYRWSGKSPQLLPTVEELFGSRLSAQKTTGAE